MKSRILQSIMSDIMINLASKAEVFRTYQSFFDSISQLPQPILPSKPSNKLI